MKPYLMIEIITNEKNSFGDQIFLAKITDEKGFLIGSYSELNHEGNHKTTIDMLQSAKAKYENITPACIAKISQKRDHENKKKLKVLLSAIEELVCENDLDADDFSNKDLCKEILEAVRVIKEFDYLEE